MTVDEIMRELRRQEAREYLYRVEKSAISERCANCGESIDGERVRRVVNGHLEFYGSQICADIHARKVVAVRAMSSFNLTEASAGHDALIRLNDEADAIARRGTSLVMPYFKRHLEATSPT